MRATGRVAPSSLPVKVSIEDLEKEFPGRGTLVKALGPVTLDIRAGEFLCLLGPSGCGKSTLLRIVAGLTEPTAGSIELRPRKGGVPYAMVFQDYAVYPWKTVLANVRLGLEITGTPRAKAKSVALDWLERLGLQDFLHAYPDTLSGGMRQRVGIARALAVEPEILLMDEPFAALDPQMRLMLQEELLSLWEETNRTVLFVTHSLDEAITLGDRIVVMSSRPGVVLDEIDVDIPRPRHGELARAHPNFSVLHEKLWSLLRGELV